MKLKNNVLIYRCKTCNTQSYKSIGAIKIKFPNTYQYILLSLRKGVYPYECMDNWERFNESMIPPKKSFYSEFSSEI